MTAIDLSRDLELWVDFDSDYWDAQRNQIQDQSGYGRHPVASGGPTVGVNGPNDFEAASFDGTDDSFDVGNNLDSTDPFTLCTLAKKPQSDSSGRHNVISNSDFTSGYGISMTDEFDDIRFAVYDGDANVKIVSDDLLVYDKWFSIVAQWDGEEIRLIVDGVLIDQTSMSTHTTSIFDFQIGQFGTGGRSFDGSISFVSYWNRALSDAEIEYLNNLTAPRRSQL